MHHFFRSARAIGTCLISLLLLTNCQRHISIKSEKSVAESLIKNHISETIIFDEQYDKVTLTTGLSREEAIRLSILNNKALQASFQELGIAKSDLIQAGLLRNPTLSTEFNIPKKEKNIVTNIDIHATIFSLTELWQIPLRKKTFNAKLEVALYRFIHHALDTLIRARKAYDRVLYAEASLKNAREIESQMKALRTDIIDRQSFGFASDFDIYFAQLSAGQWELKVTTFSAEVANARLELCYILGLDPDTYSSLRLTDSLVLDVTNLPSIKCLLEWAMHNHPELLLAQKKICYYTDLIAYEKSRILKDLTVGAAYQQDFEGPRGTGPYLTAEVPLFDQNQAQIAQAQYQLKQAEKEYEDIELRIGTSIRKHHQTLQAWGTNINLYKNKLTQYNVKALAYTKTFQKQMQITVPTLLLAKTELYKTERKLLKTYYKALTSYAELERATGRRLTAFLEKST